MSEPNKRRREPQSETAEKKSITKTHEEFIAEDAQPSITKQEYRKMKEGRSSHEAFPPHKGDRHP